MPAILCSALILIAVIGGYGASNRENGAILARFDREKISLEYPSKYYEDAKILTLPKKVSSETEGPPVDVGPARYVGELRPVRQQPRHGGRYYYPSYSVIYVTPLHDKTVGDFGKTYSRLSGNARLLQDLLKERPNDFYAWTLRQSTRSGGWELPDEPFNNAGACLRAKFHIILATWGQGCRFVTYTARAKQDTAPRTMSCSTTFKG